MSVSFIYPYVLGLFLLLPLTAGLALLGGRRSRRARFWAGLGLRLLLLSLIVLALAGIQIRRRTNMLTAVFLLDASDSIPAEEQARGEELIRQAVRAMPSGDRAAVVVFGKDALVERLATDERLMPGLTSVPVTVRTDIASALQLGLALFPDEGAKRLILLSDGRENLGYALAQAELAAAHDIQLVFVPLGIPAGQGQSEVWLEVLEAPTDVRQGEKFDLAAIIHSSQQVAATLRVFGDGQLFHSQDVLLQPGTNRFSVPAAADESGFRRFRAQILPDADTRLQNNEASAFTVVHGAPRILLVEGSSEEGTNLAQALQAAKMEVSIAEPEELPSTLPDLAAFDAIILANVPAATLPAGAMQALQVYVRDLGKGLLVTGGENAFGAGGYLRTPLEETLPVDMDVRSREQSPNLALVLAVDKSGSMGRCHCDNPDLNQTYVRREVGQPKVDIAKEAIMRAADALGPQDYLGVIAFDESGRWALELRQLIDQVSLEQSIGSIRAEGRTNLRSGVEAAYAALQTVNARRKHLILLTDGWVHQGDLAPLAREMQEKGITLSVVAAGQGSAEYLADLARQGGGRYYPAVDILRVPDFFLKETVQAVGQYIVEEAFYPLPLQSGSVLRGLDPAALPPLLGYNGTTAKSTAFINLATPRGDPLLATWQYGLGRAAVWTSDLKGQWAAEWIAWEGFPRFAAQLVGWTMPAPQIEGLQTEARLEDDRAIIQVMAADSLLSGSRSETDRPLNFLDVRATLIDPDLQTTEIQLSQVGAGRYEAGVDVPQPGTYLIRVAASDEGRGLGQETLGLVVPYSPEYKTGGIDLVLLRELADRTGGGQLAAPDTAFIHDLPSAARAREIWAPLLLLIALLFPLDVALRRVMLGPRDFRAGADWLRQRLPARPKRPHREERALGRLFQARDRIRQRRPVHDAAPLSSHAAPSKPEPPSSEGQQAEAPPDKPAHEDSLARLREAKRRARRDE